MPNFVTARIFLEDTSKGLGESRETLGSLNLEEGFDAPYWSNKASQIAATVPASVATMLLDGVVKLFSDFTELELSEAFLGLRESLMNAPSLEEGQLEVYVNAVKQELARTNSSLEISLMVYPRSTVLRQLDQLSVPPQASTVFLASSGS